MCLFTSPCVGILKIVIHVPSPVLSCVLLTIPEIGRTHTSTQHTHIHTHIGCAVSTSSINLFYFVVDRSEAQKDIHRASLMWAPIKEDDVKSEESKKNCSSWDFQIIISEKFNALNHLFQSLGLWDLNDDLAREFPLNQLLYLPTR